MSVVLRQKLFFELAKIHIISHTTKQLRFFLSDGIEEWKTFIIVYSTTYCVKQNGYIRLNNMLLRYTCNAKTGNQKDCNKHNKADKQIYRTGK